MNLLNGYFFSIKIKHFFSIMDLNKVISKDKYKIILALKMFDFF